MTDKNTRRARKSALNNADLVHVFGWIAKTDVPAFDKLVAEAADDVKAALKQGDE